MATPKSLFIYYTVPQQHEAAYQQMIVALFAYIQKTSGIQGELLKRIHTEPTDGAHTWMEIYRDVPQPDVFLHTLNAALAHARFTQQLGSERHLEVFEHRL